MLTDYRTMPPGLARRLMYSLELRLRGIPPRNFEQLDDLSYEYLTTLEPVVVGVSSKDLILNTKVKINMNNQNFCCVCQEDISLYKLIRILKCNHVYHENCLSKHVKTSNKCPTCRREIVG